jgi:hypothetical protein
MLPFPYSTEEWDQVTEVALKITNANLMDDAVLRMAYFNDLCAVLGELAQRHGDHPILLETEADFHDNPQQQCALYARANSLAERHRLPRLSIAISWARLLLERLGDRNGARMLLLNVVDEVQSADDQGDVDEWHTLMRTVNRQCTIDATFKSTTDEGD